MKQTGRSLKKWRKSAPMAHKSFAEKRGRLDKHIEEEIKEAHKHDK